MEALWKGSISNTDNSVSQSTQNLLTDKLVEKILYMALPASNEPSKNTIENRVQAGATRPGLSIPIMSRNFIQLNSRLGLPFMLFDEVIRIFNWTNPAYTMCILSFYSFLVLKPLPTLVSGPIIYILFGIMTPTYMEAHMPDPDSNFDNNPIPARGPPLREPNIPGPVPELSREFILNLIDLQNHMTLYVASYDFLGNVLAKFAYFQNEKVSSAVFLAFLVISCINALTIDTLAIYIPWKLIFLSLGWLFAILLHPKLRDRVLASIYSEETRLRILTCTNKLERLINEQFDLYEPRDRKEASIFELQKFNEEDKTWENIGYSISDFTLFSQARIEEIPASQVATASTLEEVKPPLEWEWLSNFDWSLDLDPIEWVSAEYIQYVDVDAETKWVYDVDLEGHRYKFRRRRWIRVCTRAKHSTSDDDFATDATVLSDTEAVDPDDYNGYAAITHTSFTGGDSVSDKEKSKNKTNSKDLADFASTAEVKNSSSTLSLSSFLSQNSSNAFENNTDRSKAIRSLSDLLNLGT